MSCPRCARTATRSGRSPPRSARSPCAPTPSTGPPSTPAPARRQVPLPTYAFQHKAFWLHAGHRRGRRRAPPASAPPSTRCSAPWSTSRTAPGLLLTGRLSVQTHPWLADHAVARHRPGARHRAGRDGPARRGPGRLRRHRGADAAGPAGAAGDRRGAAAGGRRRGDRHRATRPDRPLATGSGRHVGAARHRHARRRPRAGGRRAHRVAARAVPPRCPSPTCTTSWPTSDSSTGRRSRACKPCGGAATTCTPRSRSTRPRPTQAGRFGLHPALLDSALHALVAAATGERTLALPFSWTGITLAATGAAALRVQISPAGDDAFAIDLADDTGAPVAVRRRAHGPADHAGAARRRHPGRGRAAPVPAGLGRHRTR